MEIVVKISNYQQSATWQPFELPVSESLTSTQVLLATAAEAHVAEVKLGPPLVLYSRAQGREEDTLYIRTLHVYD